MTHLVFGASGQVGRFLLPRLVARGADVCAVSRDAHADADGVRWRQGTLPDAVPVPRGAAALVSLGPVHHFVSWLERATFDGRPRVVALSSMSADSKRASPDPAERAIAGVLADAERRLAARCEALGLAWTVLRPTLIYGAGSDKSITPLARRAARWHAFPLPAAAGLRQPVHADDLALAVLAALDRPESAGRVLAFGGGERLTAAAMFARVRASVPTWTLPLFVPAWAQRVAAAMLPRLRGPLSRLQSDLIADNAEAERLLGVRPRGFRPPAP
ncbi:MAG: NAD-dependent epimerase/dehydratase family protein [Mizugakiibacter sp.]|uniref:SDR family oxidoreductase n=1 Tax=Mizugakiibacter sp. TaxID=1972610 RepID=UPI0031C07F5A|nr:NAD(P)H-binding protein [Xanthomonadaceae bacterium]